MSMEVGMRQTPDNTLCRLGLRPRALQGMGGESQEPTSRDAEVEGHAQAPVMFPRQA